MADDSPSTPAPSDVPVTPVETELASVVDATPAPSVAENTQIAPEPAPATVTAVASNSASTSSPPTPPAEQKRGWSADDRKASIAKRIGEKEAILEKVMHLARTQRRITNNEIVKRIHVSDISATRYARILVARGRLKREGKGRNTAYSAS